jgi:hypothetical protein
MSDRAVELFERYLEQCRAGSPPDPAALIAEAGDGAEALSGMIAAYLAATPPPAVAADQVLALAARPQLEPPRPWPQLLPELRGRRGTTRAELVRRLAQRLGVAGSEPQVAGYLHELETGLLSPRRVRPAVVAALAWALEAPPALLEGSRRLAAEPPQPAAPMFARKAKVDASISLAMLADQPAPDPRVDDLFTGGGDG